MSNVLQVQWTIEATTTPRPVLPCSRCGAQRPFSFSGKARLNANGDRLDAWLIYNCSNCGKTWNRPLFERLQRHRVDGVTLAALHAKDALWLEPHAFDATALRRHTSAIEFSEDKKVLKRVISSIDSAFLTMNIDIRTPYPLGFRLDQLLSAELGISRARLESFVRGGRLTCSPARKNGLRRPLPPYLNVELKLEGLSDANEILQSAVT